MMKSFFKKLAFVMALAMVVSMAAPAAQKAVAAEDKALAIAYQKGAVITALNLVEVGDTEDLRFVYAPANWKELGVEWSSSNENVVSVDANGVVKAEAAGTATISVAVGTETASIEVYSVDTTTFVATMGTADNRAMTELELTVGEEFDFAFYGIKDYSVDYYRCDWFAVDPDGVLDFNDANGKLVAKKAGSAKISLGVMNLITGIKTDVAPCTVTVKAAEPEVDPNNFEVTKMLSDSKFQLTFENKKITADEIKAGLNVYYYVGNQRINYNYIKDVTVKDGVAEVTLYSLVFDGTTYGFKYAGIEKETTVKIGEPASMYITWKDLGGTNNWNVAYAGYTTKLYATILNAEGADITNSILNESLGKYVEFSLADTSVAAQYYMQGADEIYFTADNATAVVVATLYNGFDNLGQRVKSVVSAPTAINSTIRPQRTFTFQTPAAVSVTGNVWDNVTKLAVGDPYKYVTVRLTDTYNNTVNVNNTNRVFTSEPGLGVYGGPVATERFHGQFVFESDNIAVLTIEEDGRILANQAGSANVLVYYDPNMYNTTTADKVLISVIPFTTYARRTATTFEIDGAYKTVSTEAGDGNYNVVTFDVTIKDQLGDKYDATKALKVYTKSVATNGLNNPTIMTGENVDFTTERQDTGKYRVTITCADSNVAYDGGSRPVYYGVSYDGREVLTFTANVVNPNTNLQAGNYAFDAWTSDWRKDVKTEYGINHDLTAGLYMYKNGVKVAKENISLMTNALWTNPANASFDTVYVKVLKNGVDVTEATTHGYTTPAASVAGNTLTFTLAKDGYMLDGNNTVDYTLGAGAYTVLAYKAVSTATAASPAAMQLIASTNVDVKNSNATASYVGKIADTTTKTDVDAIAKDSFSVKIGNDTLNAWNGWGNVKVVAKTLKVNDNTTFFEKLIIYVPTDGIWGDDQTFIRYEVKVGDYVIKK